MSSFKGNLEHFGLQELLQTLSHGARTGTLHIERGNEKVAIVFETGHITFVRTGVTSQIRLRSILLRCEMVSEQELAKAREDQKDTGMLLGRALLERGVLDDMQLSQALRLKAEEELFDLFLWEDGTFEFYPDVTESTPEDQINQITRIQVDPMSVIIEGLRQADEWKIIRDKLSDLRWILLPTPGAPIPAESHSVWKMLDGTQSIEDVLRSSATTRFDTCSVLYRFIEEGFVQKATPGEMLKIARELLQKSPNKALPLYQALIDRAGDSVGNELLDEAADCAAHVDPQTQSALIRKSAEILKNRGEGAEAWKRLQRLLVLSPGNLEDLKSAWALRENLSARRMEQILDELIKLLRRSGDLRQTITVLREAETLRSSDANYWLLRGEVLHRSKDPEAESCLLKAINISKSQQPDIALRAEKILRNHDPDSALDENLVEQLRKRRDTLDSTKKLRKKLTIASFIFAISFVALHISSEWRAHGLLTAARNIEANGTELSGLLSAVEAYERVASEHPWTFSGSNGASEGQRLRNKIDDRRESELFARESLLNKQRAERIEKLAAVRATILEAKSLRKDGLPRESRELLNSLSKSDLRILPEIELNSLQFPVIIKSKPEGARIYRADRSYLGKSPVVVDLHLDETRQYFVERSGCRVSKVKISGNSAAVVTIPLVRGPLRTYSLPSPVVRSALAGDFLVTAGRDGKIRIIEATELHPTSEKSVGLEGHPAPILVEQGNKVLAVPYAGRPVLVEPNGKARVFGPTATSPRSAACSWNNGWVVGDVEGKVTYLNASGNQKWSYQCKAPVSLVTSLKESGLLVVDASRYLHQLDSRGNLINPKVLLPGEAIELFADGTVLFKSGSIWKSNQVFPGPKPITEIRNSEFKILYGIEIGWATIESNRIQQYRTPDTPSCSPLTATGTKGGTWVAGMDGILRLYQPDGKLDSEVELGSPAVNIHRPPGGQILVTLSDGRLCNVEELIK